MARLPRWRKTLRFRERMWDEDDQRPLSCQEFGGDGASILNIEERRQRMDCSVDDANIVRMDEDPHLLGVRNRFRLRIFMMALALPPRGVPYRWRTEQGCRKRFGEVRWPDGPRCDRCGLDDVSAITGRVQLRCRACGRQFTMVTGTPLERSTTPFRSWFRATEITILQMAGVMPARDPLRFLSETAKHLRVSRTTAMRMERIVRADISADPSGLLGRAVTDQSVELPSELESESGECLRWARSRLRDRFP